MIAGRRDTQQSRIWLWARLFTCTHTGGAFESSRRSCTNPAPTGESGQPSCQRQHTAAQVVSPHKHFPGSKWIADSLLPDMRDEHRTQARPRRGHHTPYPSYRWPVSCSCAGVWEALHHLWPHCRTSKAAARQWECPGSGMVGVAGCCALARAGLALVASPAHAINLSSLSPPPTVQTPQSVLFPRSEQSLHLFLTQLLLQRFHLYRPPRTPVIAR